MPTTVAYPRGYVNWVGMIEWPTHLWHTPSVTGLEKAAQAYAETKAAMDAARDRLAEEIVKAAQAGMRQSEIVKTSGYTRETVRRICRAAGVESE
jgi:DNA invertase Pin-like site-specific DNA recombinase